MSPASPQPPGVLTDHELQGLIKQGALRSFHPDRIQPASLDLTVGSTVWEVAALPAMGAERGFHFEHFIEHFARNQFGLTHSSATLSPGSVYIAELQGNCLLPKQVYGYANPKSSTGRIDVHCTLIAEGARAFNTVPQGYKGNLYVLIVPQSFPIVLSHNDALMQLRLFQGERQLLSVAEMEATQQQHKLVNTKHPVFTEDGLVLHLNLKLSPSNLVAQVSGRPIDLRKSEQDPTIHFWEKPLYEDSLFLERNQFLLATTIERVRVPTTLCAEMIAFREEYGELRTHYAGFFDPGFGFGSAGEVQDGGVVCEIRNIGTAPIMLAHGQPIGLLRYEHLTSTPTTIYGGSTLSIKSNYQAQTGIKLAKFFAPWPKNH